MSIIFTQNLGFKLPALNYWSHPEQIQDHNVIVKLQTIDNLEKPNKSSLQSTITHNTVTRYIYVYLVLRQNPPTLADTD